MLLLMLFPAFFPFIKRLGVVNRGYDFIDLKEKRFIDKRWEELKSKTRESRYLELSEDEWNIWMGKTWDVWA